MKDDEAKIYISPLEVLALMYMTDSSADTFRPTAYRIELDHKEPCWNCSKSLCNKHGNSSPPVVAYVAHIQGFERKLHRRCAEGLGFKCIQMKGEDK